MNTPQTLISISDGGNLAPLCREMRKSKPKWFKFSLILLLFFAFFEAKATHIVGGDITYTFISSTATTNTYRVRLTLFRDCAGIAVSSSYTIRAYNANSSSTTPYSTFIVTQVGPPIERSAMCTSGQTRCTNPSSNVYGVQEYKFEGNLTVPNDLAFPLRLAIAECCRANGISNLNNPGNQETYLATTIPPQNSNLNNNSPVFLNPSVGSYCVNQLASLSLNAYDPDGDAIVYSLVAPRRGSVTSPQNVTYASGFSATSPVSSSTPFTIDPATGIINFTPTVIGQRAVVGIRAEEYRNGVKIGEIYRDLEILVVNCNTNTVPSIAPINNQVVQVGQSICIPITVSDANNDNITLTANSGLMPPATFTVTSSGPGFANAEFCFTATPAHAANTFAVSINASDDNCPVPGSAVRTFNITVPCASNIPLQSSSSAASCGQADGSATASMLGGIAPFSYSWVGPNGFASSNQNISGLAPGLYVITIVDGNHCTGIDTVIVEGSTSPISITGPVNDSECGLNNGSIDVSASGGVAPYTYSLNGGPSQATGSFTGLASGNYTITVTDANGCTASSNAVINSAADVTPPVANCKNVTLYLNHNGIVALNAADINDGSYDACGNVTLSIAANDRSFDCSQIGVNTVILTVTDESGNVSTCNALVTVLDTIVPDLHCQNATIFLDANGVATLTTGQVLHHDHEACTVTSTWLSQSSFDCANLGENIVTVFGMDNSGNIGTCLATVEVIDLLAPVPNVASLPDIVAECSADLTAPTAMDNCFGIITATTNDPLSYNAQGTYVVTWTYEDAQGNTINQIQNVIVNDVTPPVALCNDVNLTIVSNGIASINVSDVNNNSFDNFGIASMTLSQEIFTCNDAGENQVILSVTDFNGNTNTCISTVTIPDAPTCSITSIPTSNVYTGGNPYNLYIGYGGLSTVLSSSVSGGTPVSYQWSSGANLSCTNCPNPTFTATTEGYFTYTLTVTFANGCTSTCDVTICVKDIRVGGKGNGNNGKGNGNNADKVIICHLPPGNPNNPQTLSIGASAVPSHLENHYGDALGECGKSCDNEMKSFTEPDGELLINEGFETVIYPNPTSGDFTIMIHSDSDAPITAAIFDITGSKIMDINDIQNNEPYVVSRNLRSGIYLILINQNGYQEAIRLVRKD